MALMKYYIPIFALLVSLILVGAGCGNKDTKNTAQNKNPEASQNRQSFLDNENFADASLSDLTVGAKILVMGSTNSDGSVTAESILIGASQEDFQNIMRAGMEKASSTPFGEDVSAEAQGQRPESSQFQNMSQEERQKFMEERMKERGIDMPEGGFQMPTGQAGGTGQIKTGMRIAGAGGMANINGEILSINDSVITIKLADGGSKIIFISSDTAVKKIKDSQTASQTQ